MVQCVAALLDFAYLARRSEHDTYSLEAIEAALASFHELRDIFVETGVRPNGFNLPRQHALVHYVEAIRKFGSPNGLCSSITESKHIEAVKRTWHQHIEAVKRTWHQHIEAVKRTWRRSSKHQPLGQMVQTLSCLSKMAAARVEFGRRGMLHGDVLTAVRLELGDDEVEDAQTITEDVLFRAAQAAEDARDAGDVDDAHTSITLGSRHGKPVNHLILHCRLLKCSLTLVYLAIVNLNHLADELGEPDLHLDIPRFLHGCLFPDGDYDADGDLEGFPHFSTHGKVGIHQSATIVFHAPSELSGPHGMRREIIRCNPDWYKSYPRYDTVLITVDPDQWGMARFRVARLRCLLSIPYDVFQYKVAYVEWFSTHEQDPVTGMCRECCGYG